MTSVQSSSTPLRFARCYEAVADALILWVNLHVFPRLQKHVGVDDIVQEVWCRAYRQFGSFDPERGSFRSWVLGIAEKVLLEELRHLSRAPESMPSPANRTISLLDTPGLEAEMTSISERAARRETVSRLFAQAARLGEDDRRLLLYRGVEELTYEEIGRRLGQGPEAIRSRWRRLRQQLKWQL